MVDTLILHGGGPKTGTSYLQHVLARNHDVLLKNRILYPEARNHERAQRGEVTSGNGIQLANYINRDLPHVKMSRDEFLNTFCRHLDRADVQTLVFSSEFISLISNSYTDSILDACARRNIRLVYLFYVRHISSVLFSAYSQRVKRESETRSIAEFIRESQPAALYLNRLRGALKFLPYENILCYNYDALRDRLATHLFEHVLQTDDYVASATTVNRSLSIVEAEFLRALNTRVPVEASVKNRIADSILAYKQSPPETMIWTPEERDLLESRFSETVKNINEFVRNEPVRALNPEARIGERPPTELSEWEEIVVSLFAALAEGRLVR